MLSVCPPNFAQALFPVPLGTYSGPRKKTKTKLMQNLGGQTKSIMVFSKVAYLIFFCLNSNTLF